MSRLVIIPCGAAKLNRVSSADKLYTGAYHLACKRYALSIAPRTRVFILSAKHGLVGLDQPLAPYNLMMGDPGCVTADQVREQAARRGLLGAPVVAVGGQLYMRVVRAVWPQAVFPLDKYPGGMGKQMQALKSLQGTVPAG